MPMYYRLRDPKLPLYYRSTEARAMDKRSRRRTVDNLIKLRAQLAGEIPARSIRNSLLLATWNIRDFGSSKLNPSPRLTESLYYIAEIITAFDLVALQEVNENMSEFYRLMDILGPSWKFIATDVAGNNERMVFVYDTNKVQFLNIAGEIVLDKKALVAGGEQFNRTPYLVKFQTGWLKFNLCTVHLYYGDTGGPGFKRRVEEIDRIAGFLANRSKKERERNQEENYVLLGDMNIVSAEDETMKALRKHKFLLPADLAKGNIPTLGGSNMNRDKFYDQIAVLRREGEMELGKSEKNAGVFNYYDSLFTEGESEEYFKLATNNDKTNKGGTPIWGKDEAGHRTYFTKSWRTWQMSDHLPLWVELEIDFTERYLNRVKEG